MVPPTENSPPSASICADKIRKIVLLPTPLAPTIAACSPGVTLKLTSKNNWSEPGGPYSNSETMMLLIACSLSEVFANYAGT